MMIIQKKSFLRNNRGDLETLEEMRQYGENTMTETVSKTTRQTVGTRKKTKTR
jgi:hypothetical protein